MRFGRVVRRGQPHSSILFSGECLGVRRSGPIDKRGGDEEGDSHTVRNPNQATPRFSAAVVGSRRFSRRASESGGGMRDEVYAGFLGLKRRMGGRPARCGFFRVSFARVTAIISPQFVAAR